MRNEDGVKKKREFHLGTKFENYFLWRTKTFWKFRGGPRSLKEIKCMFEKTKKPLNEGGFGP